MRKVKTNKKKVTIEQKLKCTNPIEDTGFAYFVDKDLDTKSVQFRDDLLEGETNDNLQENLDGRKIRVGIGNYRRTKLNAWIIMCRSLWRDLLL